MQNFRAPSAPSLLLRLVRPCFFVIVSGIARGGGILCKIYTGDMTKFVQYCNCHFPNAYWSICLVHWVYGLHQVLRMANQCFVHFFCEPQTSIYGFFEPRHIRLCTRFWYDAELVTIRWTVLNHWSKERDSHILTITQNQAHGLQI